MAFLVVFPVAVVTGVGIPLFVARVQDKALAALGASNPQCQPQPSFVFNCDGVAISSSGAWLEHLRPEGIHFRLRVFKMTAQPSEHVRRDPLDEAVELLIFQPIFECVHGAQLSGRSRTTRPSTIVM